MLSTLLLIFGLMAPTLQSDPVVDQLPLFKNGTTGPVGTLTTSSGAPVASNLTGSTLNTNLNRNPYFIDALSRFVRENIPERVVHTKGAGAFGYFETTADISDICSAEFLSEVGKKTPLVARFSVGVTGKGGPDTTATPMGFAIKLYTQEGNFDLLGLNFPIFVLKDPINFVPFIHVMKNNPQTYVPDVNMIWDFATKRPESMNMLIRLFGGEGIPARYADMPCYPIETYQVYNAKGTSYAMKFSILPQNGVKYMNSTVAASTTCSDLNYYAKDLYRGIANGEYPKWDVYVQILSEEEVNSATVDVFDTTRVLPSSTYPMQKIGEIVLNKNPTNYFIDIEQLAMSPAHVVPGVKGSPSKTYEARCTFYPQAQGYRLGPNYNEIPVNFPYRSNVSSYGRDGLPPAGNNGGASPNYYPNSFNGPKPYVDANIPDFWTITQTEPNNFDQAMEYYESMSDSSKSILVDTIVGTLCYADPEIQNRALDIFTQIHADFSCSISEALTSAGC